MGSILSRNELSEKPGTIHRESREFQRVMKQHLAAGRDPLEAFFKQRQRK
jgi:hypothetical protein